MRSQKSHLRKGLLLLNERFLPDISTNFERVCKLLAVIPIPRFIVGQLNGDSVRRGAALGTRCNLSGVFYITGLAPTPLPGNDMMTALSWPSH